MCLFPVSLTVCSHPLLAVCKPSLCFYNIFIYPSPPLQLVIGCVAAVSAAPQGFFGLVAHPNGAVVPVDEPRVAAARAEHLAAAHAAYAAPAVAPAAVAPAAAVAYAGGYAGPLNLNAQLVAHPNGAVVPGTLIE